MAYIATSSRCPDIRTASGIKHFMVLRKCTLRHITSDRNVESMADGHLSGASCANFMPQLICFLDAWRVCWGCESEARPSYQECPHFDKPVDYLDTIVWDKRDRMIESGMLTLTSMKLYKWENMMIKMRAREGT